MEPQAREVRTRRLVIDVLEALRFLERTGFPSPMESAVLLMCTDGLLPLRDPQQVVELVRKEAASALHRDATLDDFRGPALHHLIAQLSTS